MSLVPVSFTVILFNKLWSSLFQALGSHTGDERKKEGAREDQGEELRLPIAFFLSLRESRTG